MLDFTGKTVLVTGGGAGIGRAIAEAFGRTGASVVVAELDAGRVADTRAALEGAGVDALVSQTDVRDRAAVDALMEQVKARFGGLDVLVNNVGDFLGIAKPFQYVTDEELDALYATNMKSVFLTTRAAIPLLRSGGSSPRLTGRCSSWVRSRWVKTITTAAVIMAKPTIIESSSNPGTQTSVINSRAPHRQVRAPSAPTSSRKCRARPTGQ